MNNTEIAENARYIRIEIETESFPTLEAVKGSYTDFEGLATSSEVLSLAATIWMEMFPEEKEDMPGWKNLDVAHILWVHLVHEALDQSDVPPTIQDLYAMLYPFQDTAWMTLIVP